MATVRDLCALYENFMLTPQAGRGVCQRCFNLTDGYDCCYACTQHPSVLDVVVPISYSVAHEQLHHALFGYKRPIGEVARRLAVQLAAVLWQFLDIHEPCVAGAAGIDAFPLVTSVPSGDGERDERHPLRWIVSELVGPTRERYERLLHRSSQEVPAHVFSREKFVAHRALTGEAVLLIDDTWTTGANLQSAARALKDAGAGPLAGVVIGRHLNRDWHENDRRLGALRRPFDWRQCVLCRSASEHSSEATAA
jgi:predicted amidophosphoribosyltransferase